MAARLAVFHLRKKAYGQFEPPKLYDHVVKQCEAGRYDMHLLRDYSPEEFAQMDEFIDHWRDMDFSYAAVKQLEGKYLVQNRVTGEIHESPQMLYMLVGMCLFQEYKGKARIPRTPTQLTLLNMINVYRYCSSSQSWQIFPSHKVAHQGRGLHVEQDL